ncbi:MAG TPA: hypothetical protein VFN21_06255 [Acidimicrobiales bacterium]|nr:hypothetical protein [Acidimicrobiales bacterium]
MSSAWSRRLALFGVVALTVVGATTLRAIETAEAANCATPAAGHVAVVIDFGSAAGAPTGLLARCVTVSAGARGSDALSAAAGSVGRDRSGKVCQIAGIPARYDPVNCSSPQGGTISYWSYFHGDASGWTYSAMGDAAPANRVHADIVEGWTFVEIPAGETKSFVPPRNFTNGASYAWQSTCAAAPRPTAATPMMPSHSPGVDPARPTVSQQRPERDSGAPGADTATTTPGATSTSRRQTATTTPRDASSTSVQPGLRSLETAPRLNEAEVEAAAAAAEPSSRPVGAIVAGVGGLVMVALGVVFATRLSRRRRTLDEESD